jgi:hypothetical protein
MGRTPDPIGDSLELPDIGLDPVLVGEVTLNAGAIKARDSVGTFNLRQGAASYNSAVHRAEDQLVHEISENSFDQLVYTGNRVDQIITWTTAGMTTKIREELYTYTLSKVTQIVTKQYDPAGVLIVGETMTEVIAYTGNQVTDITRTMT